MATEAHLDEVKAVLAARSPLLTRFMTAYMRHYARRHLHAIRIARGCRPAIDIVSDTPGSGVSESGISGAGIIVYSNHPSWWDPILCVLLQADVFPQRVGFGPMDAQALGHYGVLERIGIFGIEPDTRHGASRFLRVGSGVLRTPGTVLWVTAEGSFTDPRQRPVRLRPGVAHLLRSHPQAIAIPLAIELPFWNERAPEALVRFGAPVATGTNVSVTSLEALLTQRLSETMDQLAEDALSRDPARFDSLITGSAGIGGIYDVWRRLRAAIRGERARLDHAHAFSGRHVQAVDRQDHGRVERPRAHDHAGRVPAGQPAP